MGVYQVQILWGERETSSHNVKKMDIPIFIGEDPRTSWFYLRKIKTAERRFWELPGKKMVRRMEPRVVEETEIENLIHLPRVGFSETAPSLESILKRSSTQ